MSSSQQPAAGLESVQWLLSPAAEAALRLAADDSLSPRQRQDRLRARLSVEQVRLVCEQASLRLRAREKFSLADRMFFTSQGLQQATDQYVAQHKARRFADLGRVFDLCTGIGGDLQALARGNREVAGYDRDPATALVAQSNATLVLANACGAASPRVTVHSRDVRMLPLDDCDAWHIDPDRRPSGRRTTQVDLHEPSAAEMGVLLARNSNAAIKLAPAARWPEDWTSRAELEWIGRARQCRQLVGWFGRLAVRPATRRATILDPAGNCLRTVLDPPDSADSPVPLGAIDAYLFEPDPTVIAARLTESLAIEHQLRPIATGAIYLTGPRPIDDAALACFEVLETLLFRLKPLKGLLRARGIGQLEIKKRGVEHDPETLRRQLQLRGDHAATLFVTRLEKRVVAVLAQRRAN